jgi:uncharacterized protein (DUF924 family)
MAAPAEEAAQVLHFWFEETRPRQWFPKDPAFDGVVRERFLGLTDRVIAGEFTAWGEAAQSGLALVLLLDQFPRQIWRDTTRAFAGDEQALAVSRRAVAGGWVAAEPEPARRQFWLMPWMHSEDLAVQEAALPLCERFTDARTATRPWGGSRPPRSWPSCRPPAQASEPSGPRVAGRWPVLTQIVQPASLQGLWLLPGGLRSQLPAG